MDKGKVIAGFVSVMVVVSIILLILLYDRKVSVQEKTEPTINIVSVIDKELSVDKDEFEYNTYTDGKYKYYTRKSDGELSIIIRIEDVDYSEKSVNHDTVQFCKKYISTFKPNFSYEDSDWREINRGRGKEISLFHDVSDYKAEVAIFRFDNSGVLISANFNLDIELDEYSDSLTESEARIITDKYVKEYIEKHNSSIEECTIKVTPNIIKGEMTLYVSYMPSVSPPEGEEDWGIMVNIDAKSGEVVSVDYVK